jgi:hypothetical protein
MVETAARQITSNDVAGWVNAAAQINPHDLGRELERRFSDLPGWTDL